jgi:hypothetical protein
MIIKFYMSKFETIKLSALIVLLTYDWKEGSKKRTNACEWQMNATFHKKCQSVGSLRLAFLSFIVV